MKKNLTYIWLCACLLLVSLTAGAATKPVYHKITNYSDYAIVENISDNGLWAVLQGPTTEYRTNGRAKLVSTSTPTTPIYLQTEADETANGKCSAKDVSNDGNIVVGSYGDVPAFYNRATGTWTKLSLPSEWGSGECNAVTPDGKYAVGTVYGASNIYNYGGLMWDLTTGDTVTLPGAPVGDNSVYSQVEYKGISADGRYVVILTNLSYPPARGFIYDRNTETWVRPGYQQTASGIWKPTNDNLYEVQDPVISPNGKWFAATARVQSGDYDEYQVPLRYNIETGEAEVFSDNSDHDIAPALIDNNGNIYGASPINDPVREWQIRVGNFWYPYSQIASQVYGQNFYNITNFENTGTPCAISADSKIFGSMVDPGGGGAYIAEFPEDLATACQGIDLLGNYTVTPASGNALTNMSRIEVLFDRDIKVLGAQTSVTIKDKDGKVVKNSASGNGLYVDNQNSKMLVIVFRPYYFTKGETYTVEIPAGTIGLAADQTKTNETITLTYTGRGTEAVQVVKAYPENHAQIARIDNQSNAVYLTFDAAVQTTDTAAAQLIRVADNEKIADMTVVTQDTMAALYPTSTQYLYENQEYKVVLSAGSVTDLSGKGANEEYTLNYHGTYVREITSTNDSIFFDDFSSMTNSLATWMRYEGDHNTPVSEMTAMEFDTDNQPWNFSIRESNTSRDYCAASHSMYTPAGTSDDWMVIPQLNIADNNYMLYFDAQSYREAKKDTLKVVVWASDENISDLTADIIAKMKEEGTVVYNNQLTPGLTEEDLTDDWTRVAISLADFAGKNVYIGFWNNNTDQSMIFVDNVLVQNKVKYTLALTNAESVVNQENITVKGRLTIKSEDDTYSSVTLTLKDANGNVVSTYSETGLSLKENSRVRFTFDTPLPLTVGEENKFTVGVQLDNYTSSVSSSVKDLSFEPTRYVVLEEQTGTTCVFCPEGIVAIEHLKSIYGNKILPVSLHTYSGDPYASGQGSYANSLFSATAAPIARIDRISTISSPMGENVLTGELDFTNSTELLWSDYVASEFNTPADMELNLGDITIDEDNQQFSLPISVRSALNLKNQNINVFVTVVEDSIIANQANTLYSRTDANLGEWGKGGKYGTAEATGVVHNEVCRAAYGTSYNGTAGYFPQTLTSGENHEVTLTFSLPENVFELKNCKAVVMLINGNNDLVINANQAYFDKNHEAAGISGVKDDTLSSAITGRYTIDGRKISAPQKGINILRLANGKTIKVLVK